jgi:hypothetical protein
MRADGDLGESPASPRYSAGSPRRFVPVEMIELSVSDTPVNDTRCYNPAMKILRAFSVPVILLALLALLAQGLQTARADKEVAELNVESARAFVKKQVDAIKAGDLAAVKAGLSARQRDKVTADMLTKAKGETAKYTLEDLVDKIEGMKIKMKNGRTLTTMIVEGGKLVADTLWFK